MCFTAGLTQDPSTPRALQKHYSGVYIMHANSQGAISNGGPKLSRFASRTQVGRAHTQWHTVHAGQAAFVTSAVDMSTLLVHAH